MKVNITRRIQLPEKGWRFLSVVRNIHGDGLGMELKDADGEIDYLMRTALYCMGLVNLRYGFKLAPLYIFQTMSEFRKPAS